MKYKVGDKVKLKSKEGLDELKRQVGDLYIHPDAYKNAGSEQTILECNEGFYRYDASSKFWHESLFEGLVEESLNNDMKEHQRMCDEIMAIQGIEPIEAEMEEDDIFDDTVPLPDSFVERMAHKIAGSELFKAEPLDTPTMTTEFVKEHGLPCPEGYIFKDDNGNVINATKIVLEKKKKEYPKTYEECCKVMNYCCNPVATKTIHKEELIRKFQFLLLYRDAYWKLYGEEMGLGKPWEPEDLRYVYSFFRWDGDITMSNTCYGNNHIFEFPTEEMRDMFYENFKELIEICKELL